MDDNKLAKTVMTQQPQEVLLSNGTKAEPQHRKAIQRGLWANVKRQDKVLF